MAIAIPLENMSVEEKIQVMETIWDDLCHNADDMQSPSWHEDVLREREEALRPGALRPGTLRPGAGEFIDWDLAKKIIRKEIG